MFSNISLIFLILPLVSLNDNPSYCEKDNDMCAESKGSVMSRIRSEVENNGLVEAVKAAEKDYFPCLASNCSCFFNTLANDLSAYKAGITAQMVEQVRSRGTTYVVYQNRLYRSKECIFPARCSGVEHFLLELLPKLPDVEFILNSRDWPQISKHFGEDGPVLSFSKTPDYLDIQFPAWSFWEGGPAIKSYPRGIGRWDVMRSNLALETERWPWGKKIPKGFFRGSRTSEERDTLVLLSRAYPDLLDAQYTKNQAWKSPADTLHAEPAAEVPLEQHCKYKYLFNMRGVAASFRLKHLFLCGSLVLHFGDEWTEFFYGALKPWLHYVPVAANASQEDIAALLAFLHEHDDLALAIARRGHDFIRDHLRLKDVRCYWRHLLRTYSKAMKYPVTLDSSLQEIR